MKKEKHRRQEDKNLTIKGNFALDSVAIGGVRLKIIRKDKLKKVNTPRESEADSHLSRFGFFSSLVAACWPPVPPSPTQLHIGYASFSYFIPCLTLGGRG
jgi:hypothetical protein